MRERPTGINRRQRGREKGGAAVRENKRTRGGQRKREGKRQRDSERNGEMKQLKGKWDDCSCKFLQVPVCKHICMIIFSAAPIMANNCTQNRRWTSPALKSIPKKR